MKCRVCEKECGSYLTKKLCYGRGTVYYCEDCRYGMLEPAFSQAEEYYDQEYRKKFKDILSEEKETPQIIFNMRKDYQKERLDIIAEYFDRQKSFMEIGSSAGQFLWHIAGCFKEVVGIELDTASAEFSRQLISEKTGVTPQIFTSSLEGINWDPADTFDYIGFFQVLEHIAEPVSFLENVRKRLNENGRVFIEVPNLDDPLRELWNIPAYEKFYYHEAHLSYFSEKSLNHLLNKCGFEIENIYFLQDYNLLNHLYWYFNHAPQKTCEFGLNKPHIPFNNGKAGELINQLLVEMNEKYFQILSENKLTSNIFVVARMMR